MAAHNRIVESDFLDVGCVFGDLCLAVEGGCDGGADEDVYFVMGFDGGGHLLVYDYFCDLGCGGGGVVLDVVLYTFDG